jgi:hypothetical protein
MDLDDLEAFLDTFDPTEYGKKNEKEKSNLITDRSKLAFQQQVGPQNIAVGHKSTARGQLIPQHPQSKPVSLKNSGQKNPIPHKVITRSNTVGPPRSTLHNSNQKNNISFNGRGRPPGRTPTMQNTGRGNSMPSLGRGPRIIKTEAEIKRGTQRNTVANTMQYPHTTQHIPPPPPPHIPKVPPIPQPKEGVSKRVPTKEETENEFKMDNKGDMEKPDSLEDIFDQMMENDEDVRKSISIPTLDWNDGDLVGNDSELVSSSEEEENNENSFQRTQDDTEVLIHKRQEEESNETETTSTTRKTVFTENSVKRTQDDTEVLMRKRRMANQYPLPVLKKAISQQKISSKIQKKIQPLPQPSKKELPTPPSKDAIASSPTMKHKKKVKKPLPKPEVLMCGYNKVNKHPTRRWCLLYNTLKLMYFSDGEIAQNRLGTVDLRFKYLRLHSSSKNDRSVRPIFVVNEGGTSNFCLEPDTWDELVQWIAIIENALLDYYKKVVSTMLRSSNGWSFHKISIWIGSWNVGNTYPCALDDWLPAKQGFDIISVGAQECTYKSRLEQNNSEDWFERITSTLGPGYVPVGQCSLWEIRNIVLVKRIHLPYISNVRTETVATGIANVAGNKGAVGISLLFHNTPLLFITAHLAAHQEAVQQRNDNYKEIVRRMRLGSTFDIQSRFEYIFWYGDLNYRIDFPRDTVLDLIHRDEFTKLHSADQLKHEMEVKQTFEYFSEMELMFWPTYRFLRQTYDENGHRVYNDEKGRIPSWCDRILWYTFPNAFIEPLTYGSVPSIDTSDHCPVYGTFNIETRLSGSLVISTFKQPPSFHVFGLITIPQLKAEGTRWPELRKYKKGTPKPTLKFYAPFIPITELDTREGYEPEWSDVQIDIVNITSKVYWNCKYLIVEVVSLESKRIALGQAVIPLKDCIQKPQNFRVPITHHGFSSGYLSGILHIVPVKDLPDIENPLLPPQPPTT